MSDAEAAVILGLSALAVFFVSFLLFGWYWLKDDQAVIDRRVEERVSLQEYHSSRALREMTFSRDDWRARADSLYRELAALKRQVRETRVDDVGAPDWGSPVTDRRCTVVPDPFSHGPSASLPTRDVRDS